MLAAIPVILDAISAIPSVYKLLSPIISVMVGWYVQRQTAAALSQIADAAAFSAHAKTQADRTQAAAMWQAALSQTRTLP